MSKATIAYKCSYWLGTSIIGVHKLLIWLICCKLPTQLQPSHGEWRSCWYLQEFEIPLCAGQSFGWKFMTEPRILEGICFPTQLEKINTFQIVLEDSMSSLFDLFNFRGTKSGFEPLISTGWEQMARLRLHGSISEELYTGKVDEVCAFCILACRRLIISTQRTCHAVLLCLRCRQYTVNILMYADILCVGHVML